MDPVYSSTFFSLNSLFGRKLVLIVICATSGSLLQADKIRLQIMSITIYEMEHSPYCIPITQALKAFGQSYESVTIPNWDRSEVIRLTDGAYYQVPLLKHGDRIVLESGDQSIDIAEYVNKEFGRGRLFPAETTGLQQILVQHIENEVEDFTFKLCDIHYLPAIQDPVGRAMSLRHKERRFGRGCVDQWRENVPALREGLNRLLDRFDQTLRHRPFLMGKEPQYVDYALFGVIGNYIYRGYNELASEHDRLRDWAERMEHFRFND